MNIHKFIKKTRLSMNLTQGRFAKLIGVSRESLAKYETNKDYAVMPSADVFVRVQKLSSQTSNEK